VFQIAYAPVSYQLTSTVKLLPGTLLGADLENAIGRPNRIAKRAPFRNRERSGLLQINVFPGANCIHGNNGVLVVGGRDDNRVYVLVRK
jgi:hypothetical protein